MYGKRLVVKERNRQIEVISDIHKGIGESEHSKAMASHKGKNSTYEKVAQRFFWNYIANDVNDFIRSCDQCQKQGDLKSPKTELKSIPIPASVMKQVGVDICNA